MTTEQMDAKERMATGGLINPPRTRRGLTRAQIDRLRQPIDPTFVEKKQGLSYMAQHEVRAELTRIFGYGNWDSSVDDMQFVYEYEVDKDHPDYPREKDGRPKAGMKPLYYRACYRARVTLNIRDYWGNHVASFSEWHAEANSILPDRGEAHAMAITSVESYALRRAAINLGDRLGLGLYDKGSEKALVRNTLQMTDPDSPLYLSPEEVAKRQEEARARQAAAAQRMQAAVHTGEQS
jgi:hypothetical protein